MTFFFLFFFFKSVGYVAEISIFNLHLNSHFRSLKIGSTGQIFRGIKSTPMNLRESFFFFRSCESRQCREDACKWVLTSKRQVYAEKQMKRDPAGRLSPPSQVLCAGDRWWLAAMAFRNRRHGETFTCFSYHC